MVKDSGNISIGFECPVPHNSFWPCVPAQTKTTEADRWSLQPIIGVLAELSWDMKQRLNGDQQLAAHEPNWTLMLPHRLQSCSWGSCLQRMSFLTYQKLLRLYKNMIVLLIVVIISIYPDLFLTWQSIFSSRADAGCPHLSDVMSGTEKSLWPLSGGWQEPWPLRQWICYLQLWIDGRGWLGTSGSHRLCLYRGLRESRAYLLRSEKHQDELNLVVLSLTSDCCLHCTKNIPCPSHLTGSACSLGRRSGAL